MKIIIQLFCLGAVLFIFDSCTVTKRHFGGGYHVEWKKKWNEEDGAVAKKQDVVSDTLYAQTTPVSKSDSEKSASKKEERVITSGTSSENEAETVNEETLVVEPTVQEETVFQDGLITEEPTIKKDIQEDSSTDEQKKEVKKKVEPLTWVAFAFLLAGIGFGLLPAALFSSVALPLVLLFLLFLIAFINAVSSAMRVKRNPEKYKAKPFTWIVLFFTSLGFAFLLTAVLLYITSGVILLL